MKDFLRTVTREWLFSSELPHMRQRYYDLDGVSRRVWEKYDLQNASLSRRGSGNFEYDKDLPAAELKTIEVDAGNGKVKYTFGIEGIANSTHRFIGRYRDSYTNRCFIFKLGTSMYLIARKDELSIPYNDVIEVEYDFDYWNVCLDRVDADIPEDFRIVCEKAIEIVNNAITTWDRLMHLFQHNTFGWKVPVELDYSDDYEKRLKESQNIIGVDRDRRDPYCQGKPDEEHARESVIDHLGVYRVIDGHIVLYVKAIAEFIDKLGLSGTDKFKELCAYVLSHELFHAYQDFHVDLSRKKECELNEKNYGNGEDIEISAEFFALRFVRNILKDEALFGKLCDHRKNNRLYPYSEALTKYGDISSDSSEDIFIDSVKKWY